MKLGGRNIEFYERARKISATLSVAINLRVLETYDCLAYYRAVANTRGLQCDSNADYSLTITSA